jgi:predicted nucleotidyltransferase
VPELSHAEVEALVACHTARIRELVSEAKTSVSGSTLLGRYGGHDVDLVVLVPNVTAAANRLRNADPPLYENDGETTGRHSASRDRLKWTSSS